MRTVPPPGCMAGVGGIVRNFPDDGAADFRILRPFDFRQGGDCVLVNEQMVRGPTIAATYNVRDSLFPVNQDPSARVVGVHPLAGK